jgi:hypothetical protein
MPVLVSGATGFVGSVSFRISFKAGQGGNIGSGLSAGVRHFFEGHRDVFWLAAVRLSLNGSRYDGDLRLLL